jgi:hypothetical protein
MNRPSTLIPYDAGAACEGTQEIPTRGIPSPCHSPGPALSMDSAEPFNAHHRRRSEESSEVSVRNVHYVKCGWQWRMETNKQCWPNSKTKQATTVRHNHMARVGGWTCGNANWKKALPSCESMGRETKNCLTDKQKQDNGRQMLEQEANNRDIDKSKRSLVCVRVTAPRLVDKSPADPPCEENSPRNGTYKRQGRSGLQELRPA